MGGSGDGVRGGDVDILVAGLLCCTAEINTMV